MKITLDVYLENEKEVSFLMSKIHFKEIERIATGGMHSTPSILITFEGNEIDFHERGYIVKPKKSEWTNDTYYSIKYPNGSTFKSLEEFQEDNDNVTNFQYYELCKK